MQRAQITTRVAWLLPLLVAVIASCSPDASAPSELLRVQAGKGGAGGGGGSAGPIVSAADPARAPHNVTLNVRVLGTGFDNGSTVSFARRGVPSAKLVVNSTSYVSATELVANVTIAPDADTVSYDVVVTLAATGKPGIGSELFAVTGDPATTLLLPFNVTGLSLASDGKFANGEYSAYASGVCGVISKIFASTDASNSGDARTQTDNNRSKAAKCADYPRKLTLTYPDGFTESTPFVINVHKLQNTTYAIPIGSTATHGMNVLSGSRCGVIKFKAVDITGTYIGADSVLVTRVDASTWEVTTQPAPHNRGYCTNTGELYAMPLRFRIFATNALP